MQTVWDHRWDYAKDWALGAAGVGVLLGTVLGLLAYRAALRWRAAHPLGSGSGSLTESGPEQQTGSGERG
jgi:hypothetical protein